MKKTLYITEKGSQVKNLKSALVSQKFENYEIVALSGHITETLGPEGYKEVKEVFKTPWYQIAQSDKFPFLPKSELKRSCKRDKKSKEIYQNVKEAVSRCDEIVIASDADNEGVLLVMSVLKLLKKEKLVRGMINMTKMDLKSLEKEVHIENKIPYKEMHLAGLTRSTLDWLSIQMTIQATVSLRPILQDESNHVAHIGGVKTPTVQLVIERDIEFENFNKREFFQLKGVLKKDDQLISVIFDKDGENKFETKKEVEDIRDQLLEFTVSKVKIEDKVTPPKKPHSLTSLQSESNKKHSIKAKKALEYAQSLYDNKFLSYPRTDSNYFSESEYDNADEYLSNLASKISVFSKIVDQLPRPLLKRDIFNDKKLEKSSHTAISITSEIPASFRSEEEKNIYKLVLNRYLMQFMPDQESKKMTIVGKTNLKGVNFSSSIVEVVNHGWKSFDNKVNRKSDSEVKLPLIEKGDLLISDKFEIATGETKPRPRYTDATLLESMENIYRSMKRPESMSNEEFSKLKQTKMSLGTVATRAIILEALVKGGYLKYDKKFLVSTTKARNINKYLPNQLKSPLTRAQMERELSEILNGEIDHRDIISKNFESLKLSIKELKEISSTKLSHIEIKSKGSKPELKDIKCPICQSGIIESPKTYRCVETGKFDPKKKSWEGSCKFSLFKKHNKFGPISKTSLKKLLNGETLKSKKGNLTINTSNSYFLDFFE
jgi:DNA topoisomerase-3